MMKYVAWVLIWLAVLWPKTALWQTTPVPIGVRIMLLDASGQPVPAMRVELVLFQYAASVEPYAVGGCETDSTGSCLILTSFVPSSGAAWYEGVVYVGTLGRQRVGWQGTETLLVIQLNEAGRLPTEEPPLHGPFAGQEQAPTDAAPDEERGWLTARASVSTTVTPTRPAPPTSTLTVTPTSTLETVVPLSEPAPRGVLWVWGLIGSAGLAGAGWYFKQRKHKEMNRNRLRCQVKAGLLLCLLLLGLGLTRPVMAAPSLQSGEDCNPFNPDGTVQTSSECKCADDPGKQSYCMPATEYLRVSLGQMVALALLSGAEKLTGLLWLLERLAVLLAQYALEGGLWTQIREGVLSLLTNIMGGSGGVLDLLIRGPNGLLYLALLLAGLMLIVPFALFGQRPVQVGRVMTWGIFVLALFVIGTQGFDLIGALENLRIGLMQTILSGETVNLTDLVAAPMGATQTEATTLSETDPLALPVSFTDKYFPPVEEAQGWRFRVLVASALNNLIDVVFPANLIQAADLHARNQAAVTGIILALLTLVPAFVLLLVAIILMLLTGASLVLIIFFVAAIPLGFFEFGAVILGNIARQYMGIVVISLFAAIFVKILSALGVGIFGNSFGLSGMVVYLAGLGLVIIALQAGVKQAWRALDGSLGLMQTAFVSVGGLAASSGPVTGTVERTQHALGSAVQTAAALGMGAATGGTSFLATGLGGMLTGQAASPGQPDPTALQTYAAPAPPHASPGKPQTTSLPPQMDLLASPAAPGLTPSAPRLAGGTAAARTGNGRQTASGSKSGPATPALAGTQPVRADTPALITPARPTLEQAEYAFFEAGDEPAARRLLTEALGSARLAETVLDVYRQEGQDGAQRVQQTLAVTQATVAHHPHVVANGHYTPTFLTALAQALRQAQLPATPLRDELVRASVRQVEAVKPREKAEVLAYAVKNPADTVVTVADPAAQYKLHDLAQEQEWELETIQTLFAAYLTAQRDSPGEVGEVFQQLVQQDAALRELNLEERRVLAETVPLLLNSQVWLQRSTEGRLPAPGETPSPQGQTAETTSPKIAYPPATPASPVPALAEPSSFEMVSPETARPSATSASLVSPSPEPASVERAFPEFDGASPETTHLPDTSSSPDPAEPEPFLDDETGDLLNALLNAIEERQIPASPVSFPTASSAPPTSLPQPNQPGLSGVPPTSPGTPSPPPDNASLSKGAK